MQRVADLADRIHVLDYGRSLAEGAPDEVLKDPQVVAAYLGTAGRVERVPDAAGGGTTAGRGERP
jgi:branched-chain amino acid transport system ATP-binding protein